MYVIEVVTHDAFQTTNDFNHIDENNKHFRMQIEKKQFIDQELKDDEEYQLIDELNFDEQENKDQIHKTRITDISGFLLNQNSMDLYVIS